MSSHLVSPEIMAFCLKFPLVLYIVCADNEGSGDDYLDAQDFQSFRFCLCDTISFSHVQKYILK